MEALVIDRSAADTIFSFMGASRIRAEGSVDRLILTPATAEDDNDYIDPDDYPDTTAYLNAIPGFVESIRAMENAPDSEWEEIPEECFHV